jgi:cytochrome c oxidase accessory protein FixG
MLYFIASEDFFTYILNPNEHKVLFTFIFLITAFLFYDIIFLKENFCTYMCPYAMMQSVLYDKNTVHAIYDFTRGGNIYKNQEKSIFNIKQLEQNDECTTCEACVKICPANIDIRKGLQIECINCLECVDACTSVMGKLNKNTLVSWESVNTRIDKKPSKILRGKNLLYIISIVFAILLATFTLSKKEPFLISINKTTQLYKIKNELVYNNYLVTLNNRLNKTYSYGVKIKNKNFTVSRFKTSKLKNNQRIKTVLIIKTNKRMFLSDKKDTALKLNVIFYSLEDPKIQVEKTLSFMYPKNSSF